MASLGDILRVVAGLNLGAGIQVQNVYHVRVSEVGGVDDGEVIDDIGEYLEGIYDPLATRMTDQVIFEEYSAQNITADVDLGTHDWPTLTTGDLAQETAPSGVAGLVLGRTTTPGHVGKKYFGPLSEGSLLNGAWNGTTLGVLGQAALDSWATFISGNGNTYDPVILDRTTGEGRAVDEVYATNVPAYQRRRRLGTGA